ncbi:hypothetical protein [Streptomyces californicus]|uniref:hypothetical protein n=1 Tax=Streptomyces californicus TaxID=67351 RepID=UPI0037BCC95A
MTMISRFAQLPHADRGGYGLPGRNGPGAWRDVVPEDGGTAGRDEDHLAERAPGGSRGAAPDVAEAVGALRSTVAELW